MPTYKFYYYDARGYGESIRLTFKAAGQEFEDIRFKDREEFQKKKDQFEAGVVPCLEIDGLEEGKVQIRQSLAILRYLGRIFKMYGDNDLQATFIDIVIDDVFEFRQGMLQIFLEKDEGKKKEMEKALVEEKIPAFMKKLESMLEKNVKKEQGGDDKKKVPVCFVGSKLSIADILLFDVFNNLCMRPNMGNILKDYKLLEEQTKTVMQNTNVAKWLKERPSTDH